MDQEYMATNTLTTRQGKGNDRDNDSEDACKEVSRKNYDVDDSCINDIIDHVYEEDAINAILKGDDTHKEDDADDSHKDDVINDIHKEVHMDVSQEHGVIEDIHKEDDINACYKDGVISDSHQEDDCGGCHKDGVISDCHQEDDCDGCHKDDDVNDYEKTQEHDETDDCHEYGNKENKGVYTAPVYDAHETQVSEGGEADLHKHLFGCKKNPGHTKCVPVGDFNINCMPEGYQDNDLVEYIKSTADLTVRVNVNLTSSDRPKVLPNTKVPYPFYNMRGSDVMRVGTGMVCHVFKYRKEHDARTCRCRKCEVSETASDEWGVIEITTATHVVFDDLEASRTTCRLFYDSHDSPLVTLDDWTMVRANVEDDACVLYGVTCDVELLDKLEGMWRRWRGLWDTVDQKYKSSGDKGKWTFIVSHPHGCFKQVSVGHWINRYEARGGWSKYTYTTCTCPGSSGAYVQPMGYTDWYYFDRHVHSGVNSQGKNFSGIGRDYYR